jgi:glycine/D-amino acid oxidase-like deaminating enzyme
MSARGADSEGRTMTPAAPAIVSADRVIRQVVGLRPFRRTGFNVSVERVGDVTVVHNYGHGGGGISLSWGTALLAAEHALATPHRAAAIIGAGIAGLTTARILQERGFHVSLYAADLPPSTTSNVAGASWGPFSVFDPGCRSAEFDARFVRASQLAYERFDRLAGGRYGVSWRQNYTLAAGAVPDGFAAASDEDRLIDGLRPDAEVMAAGTHAFGTMTVTRRRTMLIEPPILLNALMTDVREAGGTIATRRFHHRGDLARLGTPLIVNCTGLGAAALFGDQDMLPIKGQLVVLEPQAELDYLTLGPGDLYMMPRADGVMLGGTHVRGDWSLEPDPRETARILEGHRQLFNQFAANG